jgi:hypothetical protein
MDAPRHAWSRRRGAEAGGRRTAAGQAGGSPCIRSPRMRRASRMPLATLRGAADQRRVRPGQGGAITVQVVLSPGPCMAPGGDRPVVQGDLPRADPGGALRSVRPEQPMHGAGCSGRTDRGRRPHPELHIGGPGQPPLIGHLPSLENVADVASLDLRRHAMGQHLLRQPVEQIGRGLLRPGRNVAQPDRAEVMGAPPPASFPARR